MMILGKCFEGCTRDHCIIANVWTKKVVDKLRVQIQSTIREREENRDMGREIEDDSER